MKYLITHFARKKRERNAAELYNEITMFHHAAEAVKLVCLNLCLYRRKSFKAQET